MQTVLQAPKRKAFRGDALRHEGFAGEASELMTSPLAGFHSQSLEKVDSDWDSELRRSEDQDPELEETQYAELEEHPPLLLAGYGVFSRVGVSPI